MITVRDAQLLLNDHGFPAGPVDGLMGRRTALGLRRFQKAHAFIGLEVNGHLDQATSFALGKLPRLSEHFTAFELRSKGNGECLVVRELLWALEVLRDWSGGPLPIASGYRDVAHNAAVGGAKGSLHVAGAAVDLSRELQLTFRGVLGLGLFSGIGRLLDGRVTHVDVRHRVGRGRSVADPANWVYN